MIRILAYALCVSGFIWLGVEDLQFRESLRTCLHEAYAVLSSLAPDDDGKILNLYYESLYKRLPSIVLPAVMMMAGSTVLLFVGKRKDARASVLPAVGAKACPCWRRRFLAAALLLPLLAAVGAAGMIYLHSFNTDHAQSDAAVVLGAAVWGKTPSPVFEERIRHAVALYKAGQVKAVIFTGGRSQGDELAEAEAARNYAVGQGVPAQDVFVEAASTATFENLAFAKVIADKAHFRRLLLVSDPLHMKRALAIAADLGMDAHPSPTTSSKYTGLRTQLAFLARETYFYTTYLLRRNLSFAAAFWCSAGEAESS
jgi:uncharacterized SAM-binding protein YcdF (DUF218 family)